MSLSDFERYPLLFGPSPVHPLDRLSDHLGGPRIWAKREDCNSGLAFGGNKTRKLEYLIPDALRQGADTLVSIGGVQSNHTRQVAAVSRPWKTSGRPAASRTRFPPEPLTTPLAASASPAGPGRCSSRNASWASSSTRSWCAASLVAPKRA